MIPDSFHKASEHSNQHHTLLSQSVNRSANLGTWHLESNRGQSLLHSRPDNDSVVPRGQIREHLQINASSVGGNDEGNMRDIGNGARALSICGKPNEIDMGCLQLVPGKVTLPTLFEMLLERKEQS
jgi:hypothetical protein